MAYISVIDQDNATGELADIYQHIAASRGKIASVHTIQSLNPPTIPAHMELYRTIMFSHSPVSRAEREMIGVVVSHSNGCGYCVAHHGEALLHFWKDRERLAALIAAMDRGAFDSPAVSASDPGPMWSPRELGFCRFARQVTVAPSSGQDGTAVSILREAIAGISDREVLDATLVVGYFNFVNRIVLSLGVEIEAEPGGYRYEAT